jgi:hypothetical protein
VSAADVIGKNITLPQAIHVAGTVTNSGGDQLAGVAVEARSIDGQRTFDGSTGANGTFAVAVGPGTYTLAFGGLNGYAHGYYSTAGFTYDTNLAGLVTITTADATGKDVTLPGAMQIKGKVAGSSGVGLADVYVRAEEAAGDAFGDTRTAADGTYAVTVAPGAYKLAFFDDSGSQSYAHGYYGGAGFTYDWSAATPIGVTTASVIGKNVTLPPAMHLRGTVSDAGGVGISGIEIRVQDDGGTEWTWTDLDGAYSMTVGPGVYTVMFAGPGIAYAGGYYTGGGLTADPASATRLIVASGDVTANATLAAGAGAFRISGKVADDAAAGIDGIEVVAIASDRYYGMAVTSGGGAYSLTVAAGTYELYFYDPAGTHGSGYLAGSAFSYQYADAVAIDVSAGVWDADIVLPDGLHIVGKVTGPGGAGVPGIEVHADGSGGLTAADGTYSVVVAPGDYKVAFEPGRAPLSGGWYGSGGFEPDSARAESITVTTTDHLDVDVELPARGLPDAPDEVKAFGRNASADVFWSEPAQRRGAIVGYTVKSSPGGRTCVSEYTECVVYGLKNGQTYTFTVTAMTMAGAGPASTPTAPVQPRAGSTFVPVTPNRLVDSAIGVGLPAGLHAGTPASFQVVDRAPGSAALNVPNYAVAVTGVLSVSASTAGGFLSVTPNPVASPTTSNLNFPSGDARAAGVTVPIGAGGLISVDYGAAAGNTSEVAFDVTGYFVDGSTDCTYDVLTPNRLADSRPTGAGHANVGLSTGLTAGTHKTFTVTDQVPLDSGRNVPADAVAVTGNLTVTNQSAAGMLSLGPVETDSPTTTSIMFSRGDDRATGLTVPLGADGTLSVVYASPTPGATTDVVFDVTGYFVADLSGATYVPVGPNRLLDTRARVGLRRALSVWVAGTFQVTNRTRGNALTNVPRSAVAVTGTLTVTGQTAAGYLSLTRSPVNRPATSTLNFPRGDSRSTGVTVPLGPGGRLSVTCGGAPAGSTANVIFDVSGYFLK